MLSPTRLNQSNSNISLDLEPSSHAGRHPEVWAPRNKQREDFFKSFTKEKKLRKQKDASQFRLSKAFKEDQGAKVLHIDTFDLGKGASPSKITKTITQSSDHQSNEQMVTTKDRRNVNIDFDNPY